MPGFDDTGVAAAGCGVAVREAGLLEGCGVAVREAGLLEGCGVAVREAGVLDGVAARTKQRETILHVTDFCVTKQCRNDRYQDRYHKEIN